jgi:translation elongation factor EF-4
MKKWFLIPAMTLLLGFTLIGCSLTSDFAAFERAIDRNIEVADGLDRVAAEDLAESNVAPLAAEQATEIVTLANRVDLDARDQIAAIRTLHNSIRVTHAEIVLIREDNRIAREELRTSIQAFKDGSFTLTEADRLILDAYVEELKTIRDALIETNGDAFQLMKGLRGKYNLQNLDLVETTLTDVEALLLARKAQFERVGEIIAAVTAMADTYEVTE